MRRRGRPNRPRRPRDRPRRHRSLGHRRAGGRRSALAASRRRRPGRARDDGRGVSARRPDTRVPRRGRDPLRRGRLHAAQDRARPGPLAHAGPPGDRRCRVARRRRAGRRRGLRLAVERRGAHGGRRMGRHAARLARGSPRPGGRGGLRRDQARGRPIPSASATRSTHIATFRALLDADALDVLRLDVPGSGASHRPAVCWRSLANAGLPRVAPRLSRGERAPRGAAAGRARRDVRPPHPGGNPPRPGPHVLRRGADAARRHRGRARGPGLGFELDWERFEGGRA